MKATEIRSRSRSGLSDEELLFELAIEDLRRAAEAFLPVHERTDGVDGDALIRRYRDLKRRPGATAVPARKGSS